MTKLKLNVHVAMSLCMYNNSQCIYSRLLFVFPASCIATLKGLKI